MLTLIGAHQVDLQRPFGAVIPQRGSDPGAQPSHQRLRAGPRHHPARGAAEIVIDHINFAKTPAPSDLDDALFAGSDGGGEHWAIIASLIEAGKLNPIDPPSRRADVIPTIVNGRPNSHIDDLLPWAYAPSLALKDVA